MTDIDYKKIGLKCGIEIHQQLDTDKLFCNCPSIIRDDKSDFEIIRELRAVIGETGLIDEAAMHEQKKQKHYKYQGYHNSTCLVEIDEEPPHEINKDAIEVGIQVALMLNAKIVDEVQIMRKNVVDGSNTSGFQRTALIATDGYIDSSLGKVTIPSISLEEDSCKIVKRTKEYDIYNLSRLGIPLIEIGTNPDIKTPNHAKEVAEKLGMILRSTGRVKRGLGTIRQDVNVSITKGVRVEIKGAQDLKGIPKLVENEMMRQDNLAEKKFKTSKTFDLTQLLSNSSSKNIRKSLDNQGVVLGIKLLSMNGKLNEHIEPGKRLGSELSDYAKSKSGVGGLFHSDELPNYGITQKEVDSIKLELELTPNDAFIIIADNRDVSNKAIDSVKYRLQNLIVQEVRKANDDATSTFLRPMPGAARMYPETDTIPVITNSKNINIPELIVDKIIRFEKKYHLSKDLATQIVKSGVKFESLADSYKNIDPNYIVETLLNTPKEIKRRNNLEINIELHIEGLLNKLSKNEISKEAIFEILVELAQAKKVDYSKYKPLDSSKVEDEIKIIINENKDAPFGALMGIVMGKFRGKIDGKQISLLIKKYTK